MFSCHMQLVVHSLWLRLEEAEQGGLTRSSPSAFLAAGPWCSGCPKWELSGPGPRPLPGLRAR
jgi:hypothetical protein